MGVRTLHAESVFVCVILETVSEANGSLRLEETFTNAMNPHKKSI